MLSPSCSPPKLFLRGRHSSRILFSIRHNLVRTRVAFGEYERRVHTLTIFRQATESSASGCLSPPICFPFHPSRERLHNSSFSDYTLRSERQVSARPNIFAEKKTNPRVLISLRFFPSPLSLFFFC